jgi:hypothetical protein
VVHLPVRVPNGFHGNWPPKLLPLLCASCTQCCNRNRSFVDPVATRQCRRIAASHPAVY